MTPRGRVGPLRRGISDGTNFLNLYVRGGDRAIWRKAEHANVTTDATGRRAAARVKRPVRGRA